MKKIIILPFLFVATFLSSQSITYLNTQLQEGEYSSQNLLGIDSTIRNIQEKFTQNSLIKVFDLSTYSLSKDFAEDFNENLFNETFESLNIDNKNFILINREYDEDKNGFYLKVKTTFLASDHICFEPEYERELQSLLDSIDIKVGLFQNLKSSNSVFNSEDIIVSILDVINYEINLGCCSIFGNRNSCDLINPYNKLENEFAYYTILGNLKCHLEGQSYTFGSGNPHLDKFLSLNIDTVPFNDPIQYNDLDLLGDIYIYFDLSVPELIFKHSIEHKSITYSRGHGNYVTNHVENIEEYDFGFLKIVIPSGFDLTSKLKGINKGLIENLSKLQESSNGWGDLESKIVELLKYASICEVDALDDIGRINITQYLVSSRYVSYYELWEYWRKNVPSLVYTIFNSIEEKYELFVKLDNNLRFATNLISFDFKDGQQLFVKAFVESYYEFLHKSQKYGNILNNGEDVIHDVYENTTTLGFHFNKYKFEKVDDKAKYKIEKEIFDRNEYIKNGNIAKYKWVTLGEFGYLSPMFISSVNANDFSTKSRVLPVVMIANFDNSKINENVLQVLFTAIDLYTLTTGYALLKFSKLSRIAYVSAGISLAAGATNIVINKLELLDPDVRKRATYLLMLIEIGAALKTTSLLREITESSKYVAKYSTIPEVTNFARQFLGKNGLLSRIPENTPFWNYINDLDDVNKIKSFNQLDDEVLAEISTFSGNFDKLGKDLGNTSINDATNLARGTELIYYFNSKVGGVKAWKRLVDAPDGIRLNLDILDDVSSWPASWKINQGTVNGTIEVLDGAGTPLARIFPDRVVASGRSVIGQPGNKILNRVPLIKNMTYEVDGIDYITDNLGRVVKTSGDLDDMVRIRLGYQQIRAVDVKDGVRGTDQGGHIIGARFFGAGEQINYYPQSANLNQGAWKTMENKWADEMVAGKDVKVEVNPIFNGSTGRPDAFEVNYWIDNVKSTEFFDNL